MNLRSIVSHLVPMLLFAWTATLPGLCSDASSQTAHSRPSDASAGGAKCIELSNAHLAIRFDRASGAVSSIVNRTFDVTYTTAGPARPLFRLKVLAGDTRKGLEQIQPEPDATMEHSLTRQGDVQTLRLHYCLPRAKAETIEVTCQGVLPDASTETRWTISVDNRSRDTEIVEVVFPILGGLRIGPEAADNVLAWPAWGGGRLIPDPQHGGLRSGTYAGGGATMAWMDLYRRPRHAPENDGRAGYGLYLASHDRSLLMAGLGCQPARDGNSVTLQMSKYAHIRAGETWTSADFVTGIHAGDWHAGADSYRTWFHSWAAPPAPPAWLKHCDGRLEWTLPLDGTGRFEKDIPEKVALAKRFGLNFARFGGQMIPSVSAGKHRCNRFPFPDPAMGTEEELGRVIRSVRQQGAHVAFYINGQAWDPRWPDAPPQCKGRIPSTVSIPDWEAGFKQNALLRYDGTYYTQYPKASGHWPAPAADDPYHCLFFFMCPGSRGWAEHLHHWTVDKYVRQYGTDAMFLDQIGAESAKYCFNPAHAHAHHGAWTQGFVSIAKRIREDARRAEPEFALETEGFGDAYLAHFDSFFIAPSSTGVWTDSHPEIARYTFPEAIFFDGFWRIQNSGNLRTPAETLDEVFLIGNRFLVYAQADTLTRHTVQVVNLRRRIKHVLYPARFMDDVGVCVSDARVRVKRFVHDRTDRKITLLTVYNHDGVRGARVDVDLAALGPVREAAVAVLGGGVDAVVPATSGRRVSLVVPAEELSAILLVHQGSDVIEEARRAEQLPELP